MKNASDNIGIITILHDVDVSFLFFNTFLWWWQFGWKGTTRNDTCRALGWKKNELLNWSWNQKKNEENQFEALIEAKKIPFNDFDFIFRKKLFSRSF